MRQFQLGSAPALCLVAALLVAGPAAAAGLLSPLTGMGPAPPAPWRFAGLPDQKFPSTDYRIVVEDGEPALRIEAKASYGNLVHDLPPGSAARRLSWRWRLDQANLAADLRHKAGDDLAVKVCLLFDMPLSAVPFIERQLLRLANSRSAEPLPSATLCYVWDAKLPAGTVLDNAYTRRVRYLVLRGPEAGLRQWQSEQRDVAADFQRLFGDESRQLPPLLAVAVAGDADNTKGHSLAWLKALTLD